MMPLAPHLLLPAVGHMTAATTTANSTTSSSKPKLTFSIDSIVGRNTIETHKRTQDNNKLKQIPATAQQTIEYSPISRIETTSPPLLIQRTKQNKMSTALNQLSPSPLSTPSPILSVPNVPKSIPYIDQNASNSHQNQQQTHHHLNHHSSIGLIGSQPHPTSALSHSLMMAAAHHMPPIPQEYHQAVALYPWLLRANPFVNRFPGVPFDGSLSSFLLPPFRKPKRIRTAFSPGQLLKLEQAFEKNHYVVGNERKQLANNLGLSETQVKVWFQNRRTKHKRQKQEEDDQQTGTNTGSSDSNKTLSCAKDNNCVNTDEEEEDDEDIDLEDDDIDSDADNDIINCDVRHHVWYQSMPSAATSQKSSIESSIASTSTSIKI